MTGFRAIVAPGVSPGASKSIARELLAPLSEASMECGKR